MENQFLIKDTVAALRNITANEICAIRGAIYAGVKLLGYYEKGDTPAPIVYYLSDIDTRPDDGGSVFVIHDTNLVHDFHETIDIRYFGAKSNDQLFSNESIANRIIELLDSKGGGNIIFPEGVWWVKATFLGLETISQQFENCIKLKSNIKVTIDGHVKLINSNLDHYAIFSVFEKSNVIFTGKGSIQGDLIENTHIGGEWGRGIYLRDSKNILIENLTIYHIFGDSITLGGATNNNDITNSNITIRNTILYESRRQGISVSKTDSCLVHNNTIYGIGKIKGTAPMAGIDIEPENRTIVTNVHIENNVIYGCSGLQLAIITLHDEANINSVNVVGNKFSADGKDFTTDLNKTNLVQVTSSLTVLSAKINNIIFNHNIFDGTKMPDSSATVISTMAITNTSEDIFITNNTFITDEIKQNLVAIYNTSTSNVRVNNNLFKKMPTVFKTYGGASNNIQISNNTIIDTINGCELGSIAVLDVSNNRVYRKDLQDSPRFLSLYGCTYSTIRNNFIEKASNSAIRLTEGSNDNIIEGNIFLNCGYGTERGVILFAGIPAAFSFRNTAKDNRFIFSDSSLGFAPHTYCIETTQYVRSSKVINTDVTNTSTISTISDRLFHTNAGTTYYPYVTAATAQADIITANSAQSILANATDLATTIALVNELKAKYNLSVSLINEMKLSQNTELKNQKIAGQQLSQ